MDTPASREKKPRTSSQRWKHFCTVPTMHWPRRKKSKAPEPQAGQTLPNPTANVKSPQTGNESTPPPPAPATDSQSTPSQSTPSQAAKPDLPEVGRESTAATNRPVLESPFGSPPPLGFDASENDEITAIWAEVQARVALLARRENKEINNGLDIDDVIANLDASQEKEKESPAAQAVKVAFGRTMGLIKTVGGIVADGASSVFAPAGQCYNVISFLINACDGYQGAFDGLAELLEKCSDHLGRLDYYVKGGMDKRLSRLAAQQLLLFVQICDEALKLRYSATEKIKTGLKIAFLAENSIQGLLGEMEKLGQKERGLVVAQTFALTSATATTSAEGAAASKQVYDHLVQNGEQSKARDENVNKKRALIDVLAFDQDSEQWNSSKKAPVESWQTTYNEIRKDVVSGTGKWLFSHPAFQTWISDYSSSPILAVEGTDVTGKSYLTSSIVKYLRTDMITDCPNLRHLVSFFFLDGEKGGHGFDDAAKSLIWQLANKDEPYMKSAARIGQKVGALDPEDVIPRLLLENTEVQQMDAVMYLVIDGVGENSDVSLLKFLLLLVQTKNKRIRVFLTGTPRGFEQMKKNGVNCPSIPISVHNQSDVEKFIQARMDKMDGLADTDRLGIPEQREHICNGLLQAASGDYHKIDLALHHINTLDYMEDINRVIQGARDGRAQQLHNEIEMLNRERSPRQIQEMNDIIRWITFAVGSVSAKLASSILYSINGEVPLKPLADQIRTKYLLFDLNAKDHVEFRSPKALEVIPHRSELAKSNGKAGQEIHPGEIDIVLHFLDNVCPPQLYQKLGLREYLQTKSTQRQEQIQQEDESMGHLKMALDCIRSFSYGFDEIVRPLQIYARTRLTWHLSKVDLAMVDRDQKSQVGESLVRLFTTNESIDPFLLPEGVSSNWLPGSNYNMHRSEAQFWLISPEKIDEVLRWLRDTAVVSRVSDKSGRSWIESIASGNATEAIFKPCAIRLVGRFFREPMSADDITDIYEYVRRFLRQTSNTTEKEAWTDESLFIGRFEQWAYEVLQLTQKDTLWQTQMGILYARKKITIEAIERSELALEMDPNNWRASVCRARLAPPKEAIEILQAVISRREKDMDRMHDPVHMQHLADLNFELAEEYWRDEQFDIAVSTYTASLKQSPRHVDRLMKVFWNYRRKDLSAEIVSLVVEISKIESGKYLGELVMSLKDKDDLGYFNEFISDSVVHTKDFSVLETLYEPAIQKGERIGDLEMLGHMRYLYGRSLSFDPNRREDKIIELWEDSLSNYLKYSDTDSYYLHLRDLISGLSPLYLQRALAAKAILDLNTVANYLSKLSEMLPEGVTPSEVHAPPQLWLARYHHLDGDDAKACQTVRNFLQVIIELLSDEDESNDEIAFAQARFAFTALGDEKNALTSLAMEMREERTRWAVDERANASLYCSGNCDKFWGHPIEMWLCKDCVHERLDDECMSDLKDGKLEGNMCRPNHDFIRVPAWDGDWLDSLPKGMVPWGDQVISLDDWKQEIQKAYIHSNA